MAENSVESNFVSMKPAVEFLNVMDQYCYSEDLICTYKFNDYIPQEGDRIAIFKVGWCFVKDYVVFEWAPVGSTETIHTISFNKHILPKNNIEIYQICYLSSENELHGASSSFQFSSEKSIVVKSEEVPSASVFEEKIKSSPEVLHSSETELKNLKEENALLRSALKALTSKTPEETKNYDKDIKQLYEITDRLNTALKLQDQEISTLKMKIKEAGEEYKKIYLEKYKMEKKYEQLKSKKECEYLRTADLLTFDIDELKSIPPFPFSKE
ncbi:uncharacterized protein [Leptinotarsa decemlineata]|uniref:uncharacterized protein n=1 Tax=Leptinotarsa decemlineata TaxID=7539 RepID=UPI000C253073|nr:tax1-binding protein 1 homolog [Leptinotarsa decemlineata]